MISQILLSIKYDDEAAIESSRLSFCDEHPSIRAVMADVIMMCAIVAKEHSHPGVTEMTAEVDTRILRKHPIDPSNDLLDSLDHLYRPYRLPTRAANVSPIPKEIMPAVLARTRAFRLPEVKVGINIVINRGNEHPISR